MHPNRECVIDPVPCVIGVLRQALPDCTITQQGDLIVVEGPNGEKAGIRPPFTTVPDEIMAQAYVISKKVGSSATEGF